MRSISGAGKAVGPGRFDLDFAVCQPPAPQPQNVGLGEFESVGRRHFPRSPSPGPGPAPPPPLPARSGLLLVVTRGTGKQLGGDVTPLPRSWWVAAVVCAGLVLGSGGTQAILVLAQSGA